MRRNFQEMRKNKLSHLIIFCITTIRSVINTLYVLEIIYLVEIRRSINVIDQGFRHDPKPHFFTKYKNNKKHSNTILSIYFYLYIMKYAESTNFDVSYIHTH